MSITSREDQFDKRSEKAGLPGQQNDFQVHWIQHKSGSDKCFVDSLSPLTHITDFSGHHMTSIRSQAFTQKYLKHQCTNSVTQNR